MYVIGWNGTIGVVKLKQTFGGWAVKKHTGKIFLYIALLLVLLLGMQLITDIGMTYLTPSQGYADLSEYDLSKGLVQVTAGNWEYYPEQLYTSADFAQGQTDEPSYEDGGRRSDYGTYRLVLKLPPGRDYAITGYSFNFAQRVYINGAFVDEIGTVGETEEATMPHTKTYEYYFTPETETTEIIFQTAGFQHRSGAANSAVRVGTPSMVNRWRALEMIRTSILLGSLITVFLYYLGMFIFFSRQMHFLFLALTGLMTAMRLLLTGEKHIMELFPNLNWYVAIRMEYICNVLFTIFLLLYFATLFPKMINKYFVGTITTLLLVYGVLVAVCDTLTFSTILPWYSTLWVLASIVTLWKMALRLRKRDMHTILIFVGLLIFALTAGFDELSYYLLQHRIYDTIITGILTCIFMNMLALTLNFSEIQSELSAARIRQKELDESNRFLDRLSQMKTTFMANISHEVKTPLTVMSANAQLSKALISADADKNEICQYLDTISREAERLSRMMGSVLTLGSTQETQELMGSVAIGSLVRESAEAYRTIIEKQGNQLALRIPVILPNVFGNSDMLSQVVLNLLSNANRYTHNGRITVSARQVDETVEVSVEDTGTGVSPDVLPRIFDRYAREAESSGAGLGLPICHAIIEQHAGAIGIETHQGQGTIVTFALPIRTKEEDDE